MRLMAILFALAISGCATPTAKKMNALSLGMTKAEVIQVMGEPASTSAAGGREILVYNLSPNDDVAQYRVTLEYWVALVGGKVVSYGTPRDVSGAPAPVVQPVIQIPMH